MLFEHQLCARPWVRSFHCIDQQSQGPVCGSHLIYEETEPQRGLHRCSEWKRPMQVQPHLPVNCNASHLATRDAELVPTWLPHIHSRELDHSFHVSVRLSINLELSCQRNPTHSRDLPPATLSVLSWPSSQSKGITVPSFLSWQDYYCLL